MKALIAMSGGVDSSVAAFLTKEKGFECIGCTMKLYDNEDAGISRSHTCCSLDDIEDARGVAYSMDMPYYVFNFSMDFKEKVIRKFVKSYENGYTPNPCIDCNRYMKFDKLFNRARILGCDYVVTGHYARIEKEGDRYLLKKALDPTKDQSYVLYSMNQWQLAHTMFPLGGMKKTETRRIARRHGFVNADKPDSQDICFVPDGDYAKVIGLHTDRTFEPGDFVDTDGKVLGRHKGIIHYTIGQRRGLGISAPRPLYVCRIEPDTNRVVLGYEEGLYTDKTRVENFNWISGQVPEGPVKCSVRIRYHRPERPATVIPTGLDSVEIIFDEPQKAVTPGQAAVLYDGDIVLGGGEIAF